MFIIYKTATSIHNINLYNFLKYVSHIYDYSYINFKKEWQSQIY